MGSNETATASTGGPRVIDVFYGNGAPSGPNCTLFSWVDRLADALWDRSEVGWSHRPLTPALGALQRALDRKLGGIMVQVRALLGTCLDLSTDGSAHACGVGDCSRLERTPSDPCETSSAGIDRFPLARPPWRRRQYRELKKLFFWAPSTCPIDLFGPVANRRTLAWLHSLLYVKT